MATVREGSPFVSHGRGGAANVSRDDAPYADAGIVREGDVRPGGSTGRGGQGNVGASPVVKPVNGQPAGAAKMRESPAHSGAGTPATAAHQSSDVVPELNIKEAPQNYHIGRGGEGNALHENLAARSNDEHVHHHEGAAQRLKEKLLGREGKP